jgi:hypothetical protein
VGGILVVLALSMVFLDDEAVQLNSQSQTIELATSEIMQGGKDINDQMTENSAAVSKRELLAIQPGVDTLSPLKIDIARVKPDGAAVFAGMAVPNAAVRIFEGRVLLGKTVANSAGEWVIVIEKSLAVGQHLISITMERADGSTALADLSLVIEIYSDAETKPLVALLPETSTEVPVLIQSPDDGKLAKLDTAGMDQDSNNAAQHVKADSVPTTRESLKSAFAAIVPNAIVWRDATRILISGTSQGGVRVMANDANGPFGEALVLADGAWQIAGSLNLKKIKHHLKFLLVDDRNRIVANYMLPLTSRDLAKGQNGSPLVVVNKGDALWRIAYRQFGEGIRYVDIVRRNQTDIVDPDLIYPNQIFAVPKFIEDTKDQN